MTTRKTHYVGQLQLPGAKPENVELIVSRRSPDQIVEVFTDADTTPSVKTNEQGQVYRTANTGSTVISDFDDGYIGQTIDVIINDNNTTLDFTGTNLTRGAGTDWSPGTGDYMRCTYDGSTWFCLTWDVSSGPAGADAQAVTLSASSQIFSYNNATGTPALIGPSSIVFTCNRQNIVGSTTWALEDDIASDETAKLTSTSNTSATLTEANFAAISNNSFVKCTATADGISSSITVVKLTSGADGSLSHVGNVYLRKASAPTEPVTDDGSYNFTTATLTPPSIAGGSADDWSTSVPAADGNPLYVSQGLFQVGSAGGTDNTVDWTAPVVLASDGAVGVDGNSVYVAAVYLRKSSTPTEPIDNDGSYNFTTNTLTAPSISGGSADDWSTTQPATDGNPLYVSTGVFSIQGVTGTDSTVDWTAPAVLVTDGVDGADGAAGADGADGAAGADGDDAIAISYTNNSHAVPVTNAGAETWTGSGGIFYAYEGATVLTLDTNTQGTGYPVTPGEYRLDITNVSGDTLTEPAITGATTTTATIADWSGDLTTVTVYRITAYILTSDSTQVAMATDVTLSPSDQGADGSTGSDGDDAIAMNYTNNSHAVPVTNTGTETWTGSGGKCYIFEGPTLLTLNTNAQTGSYAGLSNSEYNLNITAVSGDTLTEPAITGQATTTATIADWAGNLTQATVYQLDAYVQDSGGNQVTITQYITLSPANQGADGAAGAAGTSTITSQLTNPSFVVDANYDGTGYSLTGSGGTHEVFEGETSRTTSATHSVPGTATKNGLTMAVNSSGVYSLSGASWTTDQESFVLRAVYSTVTNDKTYTIAKARQGSDGGCAITTLTTVTLSDTGASTHTVGFRVDSDGDIYTRVNNAASYTSKETWIGACANTSYECYVTGTGDTPTGAALNTWHATSTDRQFEWSTTGGALEEFSGTLQIRRTSDNQVLKTVNVTVEIGQGATLTLNTLSSLGVDFSSPYNSTAGVKVLTNGDVQELNIGSYTSQNSGTEWINDSGATASDYEVQLTKTSGTDPTSGPALNSWNTISTTRTWELNNTNAFDQTFVGTMTIREITNTSNSVSATVTLDTQNGPP